MRAVFYYPSSPTPLTAHGIPYFVNQIARSRVQSCIHMDRFEISVIFKDVRQVAQKAVIKRFLWKRHFPFVLQDLSELFWGTLGGKTAISATGGAGGSRGAADAEHVHGMCLHQTTEITVNLTSFLYWCSFASTPGKAWCGGSLHSPQGIITGLYLHREERALGKGAPGAPGDTPGLGSHLPWGGGWSSRGRDKGEPCVWETTSANLWNQILQFLGYLHIQKDGKN